MADQNLIPFQFETHDIPAYVDDDSTIWWRLTDICKVLDLSNPSKVAGRLRPSESKSLTFSYMGQQELKTLLVNEQGLYRLIMRSNKPEAQRFQDWVFAEVLPQIRKTGTYAVHTMPPLSYHDHIAILRAYVDLSESLGFLEDRDRLMVKDMARTLLPAALGLAPQAQAVAALTESQGFFLADRIRTLGYHPSRKAEAHLMSKGLAREVAAEYRQRYSQKPLQSARFVDGAVRPVYWYRDEESEWIDTLIHTWCARLGITA